MTTLSPTEEHNLLVDLQNDGYCGVLYHILEYVRPKAILAFMKMQEFEACRLQERYCRRDGKRFEVFTIAEDDTWQVYCGDEEESDPPLELIIYEYEEKEEELVTKELVCPKCHSCRGCQKLLRAAERLEWGCCKKCKQCQKSQHAECTYCGADICLEKERDWIRCLQPWCNLYYCSQCTDLYCCGGSHSYWHPQEVERGPRTPALKPDDDDDEKSSSSDDDEEEEEEGDKLSADICHILALNQGQI